MNNFIYKRIHVCAHKLIKTKRQYMQNCIQVHICTYTQETYLYNIMLVRAGYCVLVQMYEPPCAAGRGSQEGCPLPLGVKALHHHKNQRTSQVVAVCVCVCVCVCV